jgi:DNA-binding NtrC family response regulator
MAPPMVLVLDGDLGFLFALSQELSRRQIHAVPARTYREAHSLLNRLQIDPDLLVVDCSAPGACRLIKETVRKLPGLHIVAFVSEHQDCRDCADHLSARLHDPEDKTPDRISYCVDVMTRLAREQALFLVRAR